MNDTQFKALAALLTTITAMLCVTAIALVYDGQLAMIAVGALIGLLAPSPFQLTNGRKTEDAVQLEAAVEAALAKMALKVTTTPKGGE